MALHNDPRCPRVPSYSRALAQTTAPPVTSQRPPAANDPAVASTAPVLAGAARTAQQAPRERRHACDPADAKAPTPKCSYGFQLGSGLAAPVGQATTAASPASKRSPPTTPRPATTLVVLSNAYDSALPLAEALPREFETYYGSAKSEQARTVPGINRPLTSRGKARPQRPRAREQGNPGRAVAVPNVNGRDATPAPRSQQTGNQIG